MIKNNYSPGYTKLETHNFFIVSQNDDLPTNYSLVSEYNHSILYWKNQEIIRNLLKIQEIP